MLTVCGSGWPPPSPLSGLGLVRFGHCVALIGVVSRREPSRFSSISRNATSSAALSAWPRLHNAMGPFSEQQSHAGGKQRPSTGRYCGRLSSFPQDNRRWSLLGRRSRSNPNPETFRSLLFPISSLPLAPSHETQTIFLPFPSKLRRILLLLPSAEILTEPE